MGTVRDNISPKMVPKFYEDAELDTAWQDIAQKDVGEPEEEEEVAEKLEKLRSLITSKFEQPIDEELLSEANLKRFLRASKWDPVEALKIFLGTATLLRTSPTSSFPRRSRRGRVSTPRTRNVWCGQLQGGRNMEVG